MATASQKIILYSLREEEEAYLIKFFDLILGILIEDPIRLAPVIRIPLSECISKLVNVPGSANDREAERNSDAHVGP